MNIRLAFRLPASEYDLTPDDQRSAMIRPLGGGQPAELILTQDWLQTSDGNFMILTQDWLQTSDGNFNR